MGLIQWLMLMSLLGLMVGSFLNVIIYRLPQERSFVSGRSSCPHCHHPLRWYDLAPILSYLLLRGQCRYCQAKTSLQYPLIEILTAF